MKERMIMIMVESVGISGEFIGSFSWSISNVVIGYLSGLENKKLQLFGDGLKVNYKQHLSPSRWSGSRYSIRHSQRVSNSDFLMPPTVGGSRRNIASMSSLKMGATQVLSKKEFSLSLQLQTQRNYSSSADLPPHQEIGMPSLSPTMTEGNIAKWLKKEGDKVAPGEVLCEVETVSTLLYPCNYASFATPSRGLILLLAQLKDKATVEMECMEEGYIAKIVQGDGSQGIQVGEVIAITVEEEEDIQKFKDYSPSKPEAPTSETKKPAETPSPKEEPAQPPAKQPEPSLSKPSQKASTEDRIFASPLARSLAEDNNVPLSSIKGTASRGKESATPARKAAEVSGLDYSDIPHTQIRKITASRLLLSKQTIPHYYLTVDTCVDKLMEYLHCASLRAATVSGSRSDLPAVVLAICDKEQFMFSPSHLKVYARISRALKVEGSYHTNGWRYHVDSVWSMHSTTFMVLNSVKLDVGIGSHGPTAVIAHFLTAAALALKKVPQCNSSWTDDYIRQYQNVNINVAVQTDNGLYVPVVRDADKKGLSKIGEEVKYLAQKARDNSLKPEDYEGGTFTVSNLGGSFGIKQFCAIVNPPQAAILAVGAAQKRVVPGIDDQFKFASFMSVTLSCDHRVIDGAIGAEWLKAFKGYIENPESMML
ncbi:hypothetical protein KSS87_022400 [Heliosperma pusillum]|nr:hypothetical protein KSS87_022400 [Heliosperma pusillum]